MADHSQLKSNRIFKLEGASNFRDVGGIYNKDGRKLKPGLLYRSAELSGITSDDLNQLKRLNVKTIIDLRTVAERQSKLIPTNHNSGFKVINIPISDRDKEMTQKEFFRFLISKGKDYNFGEYLHEIYFKIAFEKQEAVNKAFDLLSDEVNLPAVIHCTAGKDRTGFISALFQLILNVETENVLQDYLLSNELLEKQANRLIRQVRLMSLFRISAKQLKPLMEAKSIYLTDVLDEIHRRHTTIEKYLVEGCKIDRLKLKSLESIFLGTN
ncbi:MAG: tyrosine-protein phosphatase [Ignavibacteriales bacterium]|nr:MAG: tyrosine-protein phosphatase [Ignavibacteriales bacterium]